MPSVSSTIPAENDLLCEGCGYTLNGLPDTSRCPECGKPIAESTVDAKRFPPAWELPEGSRWRAFMKTSNEVIFRPLQFYRTLATRRDPLPARRFAKHHWMMASVLFSCAASGHTMWYASLLRTTPRPYWLSLAIYLSLFGGTYWCLFGTTELAARLTHWEAGYWSYRLPLQVVQRGLYYHAAHYLPVALGAFITVFGYLALLMFNIAGPQSATTYLYILCGEVILFAFYLFRTYWIGMKNMMYANR